VRNHGDVYENSYCPAVFVGAFSMKFNQISSNRPLFKIQERKEIISLICVQKKKKHNVQETQMLATWCHYILIPKLIQAQRILSLFTDSKLRTHCFSSSSRMLPCDLRINRLLPLHAHNPKTQECISVSITQAMLHKQASTRRGKQVLIPEVYPWLSGKVKSFVPPSLIQ
jgi:hypothetical protein